MSAQGDVSIKRPFALRWWHGGKYMLKYNDVMESLWETMR